MLKISATIDDYSSLDGKSSHRVVTVKTEHEQVHIKTDDGTITLSRAAIQTIEELTRVR